VTLVPEVALDAELHDERVRLLRFAKPEPARSIGLAWRRTSPRKRDFAALGAMVKETVKPASLKSRKDSRLLLPAAQHEIM
jgi:LysR family hydrogen peroxide-inducible transcriptional activator